MRRVVTVILIAAACSFTAEAQTSYTDVLVLVNSNSTISQNVANYFKSQRSIPNVNMCSIAMPTTCEIDSLTYENILSQIRAYMTANGLTNSINYIVTTQGVPLKVRRSSSVFSLWSNAGSFDSDLTMLNCTFSAGIGQNGYAVNPYHNSTERFSSSSFYGVYLVTRLAGYSYNDIVGLIDRAAQPYNSNGTFVFDQDPSWNLVAPHLNTRMQTAAQKLFTRGYNTLLNTTTEFVVNKENVLGYVSWGSNDYNWWSYTQKAQPHFTWSPKALAETYVSSSGRCFEDSTFVEPTIGWQSMVADLIHENGVTGVKGYVFEPYTLAMANVDTLFNRWTDGFNLAESYYSASMTLSWMDVMIGDPKSEFASEGHLPVELASFSGGYSGTGIDLTWRTITEKNNFGFEVQKKQGSDWITLGFVPGAGTVNAPRNYRFSDRNPEMNNWYRLQQIDRNGRRNTSSVVHIAGVPVAGFRLDQNYPNPFNPSTTISYHLFEGAHVSLEIFSMTGESVATLISHESRTSGTHSIFWNGKGDRGVDLPSGNYMYRLTLHRNGADVYRAARRLTLLR